MHQRLENPVISAPSFEGRPQNQFRFCVNAAVAAAGSSQSDAAAIYPGVTSVTGPDDTKGVILQKGEVGDVYIIKVEDGADLKVYPPSGSSINAIAANGAITVVYDVSFIIIKLSATRFITVPLLPS